MNTKKKKILVLDDDKATRDLLAILIEFYGDGTYKCFSAGTLTEARDHLSRHFSEFAACIFDGDLGKETPLYRICDFVQDLQACGFTGPMMANSSKADARAALASAGCDFVSNSKGGSETTQEMVNRFMEEVEARLSEPAHVH